MVDEKLLAELGKMDFQEYMEEKAKCPECGNETLTRHIRKEPQQPYDNRWFVEYCDECDYWTCGFLNKKFKPTKNIRSVGNDGRSGRRRT